MIIRRLRDAPVGDVGEAGAGVREKQAARAGHAQQRRCGVQTEREGERAGGTNNDVQLPAVDVPLRAVVHPAGYWQSKEIQEAIAAAKAPEQQEHRSTHLERPRPHPKART